MTHQSMMEKMTPQPPFQSGEYRQALGTFATGITVVTARSDTGELVGLTVSSFTSVSLDPPLILWCLSNSSDSLSVFQNAGYFAVNILAADQQDLSRHFARKQKDKLSPGYNAGSLIFILRVITMYLSVRSNSWKPLAKRHCCITRAVMPCHCLSRTVQLLKK